MRASKARAGLRAGKPCHRRWSAYGTSREYREAPSHTRGGSRMPELGPYGSVRGARSNARPYRDQNKKGIKIISDASDPNVWSGRALQVDFAELAVSGLASMYPASHWSVLCSGPSWISARVRSH